MKVREIKAKSILVKSGLPGTDFVINPYTGCQHACVYCYARFMKRFTDHHEPWGSFVDVKVNAPEVLEKQLKKFDKTGKAYVLLSSVTDPYQPLEAKYKITREILKTFLNYPQFKIEILTKSDLVLRDIDILKELASLRMIFSMGIIDDKKSKYFEPQATVPSKRVIALAKLHKSGIKTSAFISPILPFFTDFGAIFKHIKGKADEVLGETLNTRGANFTNLANVLEARFPKALEGYKKIFFTNYYPEYLKKTKKEFYRAAKKYNLPIWGFFTH